MSIRVALESLEAAIRSRGVRERGRLRRLTALGREALICADSWLQRALPGEVVPYSTARAISPLTRARLASDAVWLLGASRIAELTAGSADAFVNVYSFAEMPQASINNYFGHVERILSGVFYMKQRKTERNIVDGCDITEDSYPIPPAWQKLYTRTSSAYESVFEAAYAVSA
jgi:hypothetical protein